MKTGGGGYKPPTEEPNPELEILMDDNVNVEIRDSVDSDSLFETSSTHTEEHTQPRPSSSKCTSIAPEDEEMETVGTFTVSEDGTLQEEVPQIKDTTSRTKSTKTHSHTTSRHQAIETELNIRVNKVKRMQEMEEELHARRMQMEEEMHAYRMKSENEMHVRRMEREEELHRIHVRQQEFLAEKLKAEMEKAKADMKF
ncbi:hypothetical protein FQR65_LT11863 [Abscondita terminalis]|nr:hypothetical protein FQR65_LT11863 [Abscondita terminalis]